MLAETNDEINVTSSASQTSFVHEKESEGDKSPNEEELVPDKDVSGKEEEKSRDLGIPNNKELVAAVHKKDVRLARINQHLQKLLKPCKT